MPKKIATIIPIIDNERRDTPELDPRRLEVAGVGAVVDSVVACNVGAGVVAVGEGAIVDAGTVVVIVCEGAIVVAGAVVLTSVTVANIGARSIVHKSSNSTCCVRSYPAMKKTCDDPCNTNEPGAHLEKPG